MFKVLNELIPVEMAGRKKKIPAGEAAIRKLMQGALSGDSRSIAMMMREWAVLEDRLERQETPVYSFSEADQEMIAEIYARMKACEPPAAK